MERHHADAKRFAGVFLGLAAPHHVIRQAKHCRNFLQIVSLHLLLMREQPCWSTDVGSVTTKAVVRNLCRKYHLMVTRHLVLNFYYKQLSTLVDATGDDQ
jgi:hypothetical protein